MNGDWVILPQEDLVPYSANVVGEGFFGKRLFNITIRPAHSHGKDSATVKIASNNLLELLKTSLRPSPREQQLRARWIHVLRRYYGPKTRYIRHVIKSLGLAPWLFTFIVDFSLQKAVALLLQIYVNGKLTACFAACLTVYLPKGYSLLTGIKKILRRWIASPMRGVKGVLVKLPILYIYCKPFT